MLTIITSTCFSRNGRVASKTRCAPTQTNICTKTNKFTVNLSSLVIIAVIQPPSPRVLLCNSTDTELAVNMSNTHVNNMLPANFVIAITQISTLSDNIASSVLYFLCNKQINV